METEAMSVYCQVQSLCNINFECWHTKIFSVLNRNEKQIKKQISGAQGQILQEHQKTLQRVSSKYCGLRKNISTCYLIQLTDITVREIMGTELYKTCV